MQPSSLIDQMIGGRYAVISMLGEGAMGSVYLADDIQLRRQVALKVLRQEWLSRPEVAKRLENECRLMAHLGPHNNIVTLFDRLTHEGNVIVVMEYVPGETVADIIERTRALNQSEAARKTTPVLAGVPTIVLTRDVAIAIAAQCLAALDFAHSKGVLHRDVKPSNIIVARDHNGNIVAKLMDFGIGKAITDPTESGPVLTALTHAGGPGPGTPAYMAPEQIDTQRFGEVGAPADLYALGVTFFEMLSLRLPFEGTYTELLHAHTNILPPDPRQLVANLSPAMAQVLLRSLKKNQAERFSSAHVFRLELEDAASDSGGGGGGRPDGSRRLMPLLAGAAVLMLAAAGAYFVLATPNEVSAPATASVPEQAPAPAAAPQSAVEPAPAPAPEATPQAPAPDADTATAVASVTPDPAAPASPVMDPALASGAVTPPADPDTPAAAPADPAAPANSVPQLAAVSPGTDLVLVNTLEKAATDAKTTAISSRFGGNEPSNNTEFTNANNLLKRAQEKRDNQDFDGAKADFLEAKQYFESAKPAPPPAPKPPARTTLQPRKNSGASAGSTKKAEPRAPSRTPAPAPAPKPAKKPFGPAIIR